MHQHQLHLFLPVAKVPTATTVDTYFAAKVPATMTAGACF
jgi:hypothetical protein